MYGLGDSSTPPTGYWVNPANPSQWLTQADAAKIGGYCMQGPVVGQYKVAGNYSNSVLACENLTCQQAAMIYGGAAVALFLLGSGAWKWLGILPAGYAFLNCGLTGVSL